MTKYEWESELRKNVHRLPDEEIRRITEYYDELFADKIERGYTESEITAQFGNPVDVADKILSEYEGELRDESVTPPPSKKEERKAREEQRVQDESVPPPPPAASAQGAEPARPQAGEWKMRLGRLLAFTIVNVITGFAFFIVLGALWIVLGALTVAFGACAVGGAAGTLVSFVALAHSFGGGLAQVGACVTLAGVGILLTIMCLYGIKWYAKGTKRLFGAIVRFLSAGEEATYA